MKNKHFFFALLVCISSLGFSQDTLTSRYPEYPGLRANVKWLDSLDRIYDSTEFNDHNVYRFEIRGLSAGVSLTKEILVRTNPIALKKFNPMLDIGHSYWWILRKTKHTVNGEIVYQISGAF